MMRPRTRPRRTPSVLFAALAAATAGASLGCAPPDARGAAGPAPAAKPAPRLAQAEPAGGTTPRLRDLRAPSPTPVAAATPATGGAAAQAPADLLSLATRGRFSAVLDALRADPHPTAAAGPLISDLERYAVNSERRAAQRETEFAAALERLQREVAAGHLDKALKAAIEAHGIAPDGDALLQRPDVAALVAEAEADALAAEEAEDWVEAGILFGRLNLLFESTAKHRDDVKRVNDHLRVLALYAPEAFRDLQRARAERAGDAKDALGKNPPDVEPWENRLRGINRGMLHEAVRTAAEQHIDHRGYGALLAGSLRPLLTLINTPSLATTFPGLADADKVESFRRELADAQADFDAPQRDFTEFRSLARLDGILEANRRTVNLPESVMAFEMTEGALGTLDEFSSMYWPEDVDYLARSTQGAFTGVGIQISRKNEQLTVISPLNGTPAQKAGIRAGDVIATVDGADTASWSLNKAVREITGPRGTDVELGISRVGREAPVAYTIRRDRIEIESIKGWRHDDAGGWDFWLDRSAGIGYVRLTQFIPQSLDKLDAAVAALRKDAPLHGLVLDLRHNPGGLLTSAIQIVDRFVDDGPLLYTVNGDRDVQSAWNARPRTTYPAELQLVVLINRGSASASEIVSGALQDRGRALIVGDRSYGKGSVQDVKWFPSARRIEYGLKVTTQYYQLPGGRIIHRTPDATQWGVDPDLAVEVTDQTVAWGLELRQEIDVLREAGKTTFTALKTRPWVRLAGVEPVDPEAPDAEETVEIRVPDADALLELGLDPQLEAALLVLKTARFSGGTDLAPAADTGTAPAVRTAAEH